MKRDIVKEIYEKKYGTQKYKDSQLYHSMKDITDEIIVKARAKQITSAHLELLDINKKLSKIMKILEELKE